MACLFARNFARVSTYWEFLTPWMKLSPYDPDIYVWLHDTLNFKGGYLTLYNGMLQTLATLGFWNARRRSSIWESPLDRY